MTESQSKVVLDLTKAFELNLEKAQILNIPTMITRLAVDRSGSMYEEFRDGWVDHTIDLFIAAAMKFDDNGELEVGFFNTQFLEAPVATKEDIGLYTKRHKISADGGTKYAPVLENMAVRSEESTGFFKKLFGGSKPVDTKKPIYLGMITDGECSDSYEFKRKVSDLVDKNVFIQIIGLGNDIDAAYLTGLEKQFSNVSFVHLPNPRKVTDEAFYEAICNEQLKKWIDAL